MHRRDIEIARSPKGFFAQELTDKRGLRVHVKTVQWSAKDDLLAPGNLWRQPALRHEAQQMFVAESAQLPARVQPGGEGKDVLIEERIPHLHRGVHRDTVTLGLEKVPGQSNASCDPD